MVVLRVGVVVTKLEELAFKVAIVTPMTEQQFRNGLAILRSIDSWELGDPSWYADFRDDPFLFFLRSDEERSKKIWDAVCRRLQSDHCLAEMGL